MGYPGAADRVVADPWQYEQEWAPNADRTLETLFGNLHEFDWRPQMGAIRAPTLVVHGDLDGPSIISEEWVTAIPNAHLLRLTGTGHYPFVETPKKLFDALNQLLGYSGP